jgi:hypothetical protein
MAFGCSHSCLVYPESVLLLHFAASTYRKIVRLDFSSLWLVTRLKLLVIDLDLTLGFRMLNCRTQKAGAAIKSRTYISRGIASLVSIISITVLLICSVASIVSAPECAMILHQLELARSES